MTFVVDVNVPIVSNGKSPQATRQCVLNCIDFLTKLIAGHKIVIDLNGKILSEYTKHLGSKKSPTLSAEFYKWVVTNHANPQKCEKVAIHTNTQKGFNEFPNNKNLKRFHFDDRKYVAVAIAHTLHPVIAQAVDRRWKPYEKTLRSCGVNILFL